MTCCRRPLAPPLAIGWTPKSHTTSRPVNPSASFVRRCHQNQPARQHGCQASNPSCVKFLDHGTRISDFYLLITLYLQSGRDNHGSRCHARAARPERKRCRFSPHKAKIHSALLSRQRSAADCNAELPFGCSVDLQDHAPNREGQVNGTHIEFQKSVFRRRNIRRVRGFQLTNNPENGRVKTANPSGVQLAPVRWRGLCFCDNPATDQPVSPLSQFFP